MPYSQIKRNIKFFVKHRLMPQGLLARTMLILVVPTVLTNIVLSIIFYNHHWDVIGRRLARSITGEITGIINMLDEFGKFEDQKKILSIASAQMGLKIDIVEKMKIDESMERIEDSWITAEIKQSLHESLRKRNHFYIDEISQKPSVVVYVQYYANALKVEIPYKRYFSSTMYVFLLWMVLMSLVTIGIAALFMKNQVRSITKLSRAADEYGMGHDITFRISGAAEVKTAGRAFLNMKNRIKKHMSERAYMLAGVSHDLRTPLTRMNLQLAMLEDKNADLVSGLKQDVKVMENMIDAYISFVKGEGAEPYTLVSLAELIREVVERFEIRSSNIEVNIRNDVSMNIRRNAITRCLNNVIGNALRHAAKVAVSLEMEEGDRSAVITVDDDGPGIAEEKFEEVFRAFYRIEDSRNQKTGGIGLGLTVSRDIINAHGGEIILANSPLGGLQVVIRLPL